MTAIALVLADYRACFGEPNRGRPVQMVTCIGGQDRLVWIKGASGARWGLTHDHLDRFSDLVVHQARQFQDGLLEELPGLGLPAIWPPCPIHPDSHPLEADMDEHATPV